MIFEMTKEIMNDKRPYIFRAPDVEDAQKCADFIYAACGQTPYLARSQMDPKPTADEERKWISRYRMSDSSMLIIAQTVNGDVIASTSMNINTMFKAKHTATAGIVIDDIYWGIGIGSYLFRQLFEIAKANGVKIISLNMVDSNYRARRFYSKFGFKQVGLLEDMYLDEQGNYYDLAIMRAKVAEYLK